MSIAVSYTLRKAEPGALLRELDDVRVLIDVLTDDGDTVATGTDGTVVAVWNGGEAYDVEFPEPMGALATVKAANLARVGRSVPRARTIGRRLLRYPVARSFIPC
ncbi:DUF4926 domain-containing protein [Methylobacterium currus]|uniref:DUF4926 domain-containing protein n=1 Tax=Methylobacterium currus TaxID=2051553 RepID=UPI001E3D9848|nr:DUF4926 domain-containing protein [Methylobacterium currus]UHC14705.1 DUF4926 domain-containing protein [Methylobacterium currus]